MMSFPFEQREPSAGDAIEFLIQIQREGRYHISVIYPEGDRKFFARTFEKDAKEDMRQFIAEMISRANLYFHVNPLNLLVRDRKAKKEDVAGAAYLYVDIDDPDAFDRIAAFAIPPTAVVFSGGGFNVFWRLELLLLDLERAERINRWLVEQLGGDRAATDVSRILRLPGTINLPDKRKRARGRVKAPAFVVSELTDWSREYSADDFGEIAGTKSSRKLQTTTSEKHSFKLAELPEGLSERLREVALLGDDTEYPRGSAQARYPSRSEVVYAIACALARLGLSSERIAGILINPKYGVSASVRDKSNPLAYALKQAENALATVSDDWPDGLGRGNKVPAKTFQNTQMGLKRLGINCWRDEFRHRNFVGGQQFQQFSGTLNDSAALQLRDMINKEFGFDPGRDMTRDAIEQLCNENIVDPVREYLDSLIWDGVERIHSWLVEHMSAEDNAYVREVGTILLVAAVRRVREPGVKFDTITVLEGPQGSGKSTAIRILASDEFYSDQDLLALDNKAQIEALEGVWLFEIGELAGMRYTDVNKVKAFASRSVDRGRPAYARYTEDRPRRGVLIGTTNDDEYLKDDTGNRRFWPIRTGWIDLEGLQRDRDQLWAEAAKREAEGASITLDRSLWAQAGIEQQKRLESDGWEMILEDLKGFAKGGVEIAPGYWILEDVLEIQRAHIQRHHQTRLRRVMNRLGWEGPVSLVLRPGMTKKGYRRSTDRLDDPLEQMQW